MVVAVLLQMYLVLQYTGLREADDDPDALERTRLQHAAVRRRYEGAIDSAMWACRRARAVWHAVPMYACTP